jgi:phage terminase large subunit-like protein
MAVADEFHEFEDGSGSQLHDTITNGVGARLEPLILNITTAGYDLDTPCGRMYSHGLKVAAGETQDDAFLFRWYSAPEFADYRDPAVWEAANPSYGVTVLPEFYEDQIASKPEGVFRRYFLNQWTEVESLWLPAGAWEACADSTEMQAGAQTFVGWDAARTRDTTAVVWGQRVAGRVVVRSRIWERPTNPANGKPIDEWVTPVAEIMEHLRALAAQYEVRVIGYDPWGIKESVQQLTVEGLPMEEVPQTNARMIPATEYLYELIMDGVLAHDGDPTLARHMRNVVARDVSGGVRMDKGRARKPMDAGIGAAIVAYLLQSNPESVDRIPNIYIPGVANG